MSECGAASTPDAAKPNVARMYDYLLGGKENYDPDRRAAEELLAVVPDAAVAAWDNREFLGRAVQFLTTEAGIRQFIDIGTGLPTRGNVHTVAQQAVSDFRVVYVDYDPVVLDHARSLLAGHPNIIAIDGDLREPECILTDTSLRALIDFDKPVAILLVAILHFITDEEAPFVAVDRLKEAMVPGSYMVISHVTGDGIPVEAAARANELYKNTTAPGTTRTRSEILRFFDGLELIEPGLVNVASWRSQWMPVQPQHHGL